MSTASRRSRLRPPHVRLQLKRVLLKPDGTANIYVFYAVGCTPETTPFYCPSVASWAVIAPGQSRALSLHLEPSFDLDTTIYGGMITVSPVVTASVCRRL